MDVANLTDAEGAEFLLLAIAATLLRLKKLGADGASEAVAEWMAEYFGIEVEM